MEYTRRTWVLRFLSASFVSQGKALRRVIAGPMARSDNAAMGREGRAPVRKTQVWRVCQPTVSALDNPEGGANSRLFVYCRIVTADLRTIICFHRL